MNNIYKLKYSKKLNQLLVVSELAKKSSYSKSKAVNKESTNKVSNNNLQQLELSPLLKVGLSSTLALSLTTIMSLAAASGLEGLNIVSGQASFDVNGNITTIKNSPNAILQWEKFNIKSKEVVRFLQESSSSTVLNRVLGGQVSQILGKLQSNGKVFIVNPAGVIFGKNSQVNVQSLVASTLDITNANFKAGRFIFDQDKDTALASVINRGMIKVDKDGSLALLGGQVINKGVLEARNGTIFLLAGNSIEFADLNNPHVSYKVTAHNKAVNLGTIFAKNVTLLANKVANGANSNPSFADLYDKDSDGVKASINAKGEVLLFAASAKTNLENTNNSSETSFSISAPRSTEARRALGLAVNNAVIDVRQALQKAGKVEILADYIYLNEESDIKASGLAGGEINIGTTSKGTVKLAQETILSPGQKLEVSALSNDGLSLLAKEEASLSLLEGRTDKEVNLSDLINVTNYHPQGKEDNDELILVDFLDGKVDGKAIGKILQQGDSSTSTAPLTNPQTPSLAEALSSSTSAPLEASASNDHNAGSRYSSSRDAGNIFIWGNHLKLDGTIKGDSALGKAALLSTGGQKIDFSPLHLSLKGRAEGTWLISPDALTIYGNNGVHNANNLNLDNISKVANSSSLDNLANLNTEKASLAKRKAGTTSYLFDQDLASYLAQGIKVEVASRGDIEVKNTNLNNPQATLTLASPDHHKIKLSDSNITLGSLLLKGEDDSTISVDHSLIKVTETLELSSEDLKLAHSSLLSEKASATHITGLKHGLFLDSQIKEDRLGNQETDSSVDYQDVSIDLNPGGSLTVANSKKDLVVNNFSVKVAQPSLAQEDKQEANKEAKSKVAFLASDHAIKASNLKVEQADKLLLKADQDLILEASTLDSKEGSLLKAGEKNILLPQQENNHNLNLHLSAEEGLTKDSAEINSLDDFLLDDEDFLDDFLEDFDNLTSEVNSELNNKVKQENQENLNSLDDEIINGEITNDEITNDEITNDEIINLDDFGLGEDSFIDLDELGLDLDEVDLDDFDKVDVSDLDLDDANLEEETIALDDFIFDDEELTVTDFSTLGSTNADFTSYNLAENDNSDLTIPELDLATISDEDLDIAVIPSNEDFEISPLSLDLSDDYFDDDTDYGISEILDSDADASTSSMADVTLTEGIDDLVDIFNNDEDGIILPMESYDRNLDLGDLNNEQKEKALSPQDNIVLDLRTLFGTGANGIFNYQRAEQDFTCNLIPNTSNDGAREVVTGRDVISSTDEAAYGRAGKNLTLTPDSQTFSSETFINNDHCIVLSK